MRQCAVPTRAPMGRYGQNGDDCYGSTAGTLAILDLPVLNKGTAFTSERRKALGPNGLLPRDTSALETQVKRAYIQYEHLPDASSRNIYLTASHDPNEAPLARLFSEHLREVISIVNLQAGAGQKEPPK